ncbi:MAG: RNA-guided pseudouridylation complex pseudouridine synthase subunit Cbf5, partial [Nitrososphaerales archaeon]
DSDPTYGYPFDKRPIEVLLQYGIIPLDKPEGPTSHEVVSYVRKILNVKKAGHSGTLDPPATGLLPVGIGEATKALSTLLLGPKEYVAVARLHDPVGEEKLRKVLQEFVGDIYQRPPQRSSVKRITRVRRIYSIELLEHVGKLILLKVSCQAGTYIRKLIYDVGEVLGCGATMFELRRIKVCHISEQDGFVRLHDLLHAKEMLNAGDESYLRRCVRPVEYATAWMKEVYIRDSAVDAICHGAQLAIPGIVKLSSNIAAGDMVAIYTLKGELVAIAQALLSSMEIVEREKGIAFKTNRVVMKQGTYERLWRSKE